MIESHSKLIGCCFADVIVGGVGLPAWVSLCYFFYTPWLANAARFTWRRSKAG